MLFAKMAFSGKKITFNINTSSDNSRWVWEPLLVQCCVDHVISLEELIKNCKTKWKTQIKQVYFKAVIYYGVETSHKVFSYNGKI